MPVFESAGRFAQAPRIASCLVMGDNLFQPTVIEVSTTLAVWVMLAREHSLQPWEATRELDGSRSREEKMAWADT